MQHLQPNLPRHALGHRLEVTSRRRCRVAIGAIHQHLHACHRAAREVLRVIVRDDQYRARLADREDVPGLGAPRQHARGLEIRVAEERVEQLPALRRAAFVEHRHADVLHVKRERVAIHHHQQCRDKNQHAERQRVAFDLPQFLFEYGPKPFHVFKNLTAEDRRYSRSFPRFGKTSSFLFQAFGKSLPLCPYSSLCDLCGYSFFCAKRTKASSSVGATNATFRAATLTRGQCRRERRLCECTGLAEQVQPRAEVCAWRRRLRGRRPFPPRHAVFPVRLQTNPRLRRRA